MPTILKTITRVPAKIQRNISNLFPPPLPRYRSRYRYPYGLQPHDITMIFTIFSVTLNHDIPTRKNHTIINQALCYGKRLLLYGSIVKNIGKKLLSSKYFCECNKHRNVVFVYFLNVSLQIIFQNCR